jgi:outer membrane protein, multidrug efflux system
MNLKSCIPLLGAALAMTAGCTMAPKYARPAAPVPVHWPAGPAYAKDSADSTQPAAPELYWEEFFADQKLRTVIRAALDNNRDLRIAALNVERARSIYGIRRAELFPAINASATAARQRVPGEFSNDGIPQTLEQYSVDLGVAAWEIDFFGRIRSLKDRALEEFLATEQAARSARILLVSSVANAYLALAADREQLRLAQTTLEAQQSSFDLIKRRHDLGIVPELDLFRARTQVETARGDVALFTQMVARDQNALQLLAGFPVPDDLLPATLGDIARPLEVSAGLPSEVLLRRPDVLQAESLLRAANADIGAARATFFPRISLTAAIGTASGELSGLFKGGSGTWSYAPQIVMPIFDARTWAAHRAAKVQRQIAVAQYERAIQSAFREVADALAAHGTVDQQLMAQESLVHAVAETYRLSDSRYEKGIDSYLGVLDAQRSLYAAEQGLVSLRMAKLASQYRLYSVLGGGWDAQTQLAAR